MPRFLLCHGWAHDGRSLDALVAALRERFPASEMRVQELGFAGEPVDALAETAGRDDGEWIGIGHSWGFAQLLTPAAPRWKALVSINGFLRFCRAPGRRTGTPARALDAMLARLAVDPEGCLGDFRARCATVGDVKDGTMSGESATIAVGGRSDVEIAAYAQDVPPLPGSARLARLTTALTALRDSDFAPPVGTPLLALAATGDLIVPPDHARAQFDPAQGGCATELLMLAGGHLLPGTHPAACADAIARFVSTLPATA
ncbi:alpha/beta fold hydrolase [Derxia gummosa]|uniref:Alpha/beta fold hydrolase n=1 Tax=Derxia gummosa DSM 723 TaxID=1121388 RepID=A0A8B6X0P1_9BURK|nr:alpha/beta hydrolase [Derxia gummosa]